MRSAALALVFAVVACGHGEQQVRAPKPGQEYLAAIRFEGNHAIPETDLLPGLALARNADRHYAVDDYQLQLDTQRVTTAFQKLGFFDVVVQSRIEHKGDAATVVFAIKEGKRATTHVEIVGLPPEIPIEKARALIEIRDGAPFDYDVFDDAKDPLQLLVEDAGYAHAHLDASVSADRVHAVATVRYVIDPGPPCTFGGVTFVGARGMLAGAARARVEFHAGDRYSTSALVRTQNALYGFGRFSSVRVDPARDFNTTQIPVKITVTEGDHNELRLGFGGGVDPLTYFGRIHLAYSRIGVLTPLTTFAADLRPEYALEQDQCGWDFWHCKRDPRVRLLGTLTQQDLFRPNVTGDLELGVDYLTVEAYTKVGAHARIGIATPLGTPRLKLRLGWTYAYSDFLKLFIDPTYAPMLGIDHANYVGAYNGVISLDLRDKPLTPRNGFYADLRVTKGTKYALGDFDYVQATPELRGFLGLGSAVVAVRARFGAIWGDIAETERYYGGGMSSQRGFSQRRLSPSVPGPIDTMTMLPGAPVVVGGAALVESSLEIRQPLGSPWGIDLGGVAFIDGGDVTDSIDSIAVFHQHWAAGGGLRYMSPIGPIGLDVAYRLNRYRPGEPEYGDGRLHFLFAVGEAF